MRGLSHDELKTVVREQRFEWRRHILEQMAARGIQREDVINVLLTGELIEDYPDDWPHPSGLFMGWVDDDPFHVVAALDRRDRWAYIITAYRPDEEHFESDWRTRRRTT